MKSAKTIRNYLAIQPGNWSTDSIWRDLLSEYPWWKFFKYCQIYGCWIKNIYFTL